MSNWKVVIHAPLRPPGPLWYPRREGCTRIDPNKHQTDITQTKIKQIDTNQIPIKQISNVSQMKAVL